MVGKWIWTGSSDRLNVKEDCGRRVLAPPGGAIQAGGDMGEAATLERRVIFSVGSIAFTVFGGHPSGLLKKVPVCLNPELKAEGQVDDGDWSFLSTPQLGVPETTGAATFTGESFTLHPLLSQQTNERCAFFVCFVLLCFVWPHRVACEILVP